MKVITNPRAERNGVAESLDVVRAQDPDEVLVIMFKDGVVRYLHSGIMSITNIVGVLERCKFDLMANNEVEE